MDQGAGRQRAAPPDPLPGRRSVWIVAILVALACLGVLAWVVTWQLVVEHQLHDVADRVDLPAEDFEPLDRVEVGTLFCVISCEERRIVLTYASDLDPDAACAVVDEALVRAALGERSRPEWAAGCGFQVDLADVWGDALALAGASSPDDASFPSGVSSDAEHAAAGRTVVWVVVSSGVD